MIQREKVINNESWNLSGCGLHLKSSKYYLSLSLWDTNSLGQFPNALNLHNMPFFPFDSFLSTDEVGCQRVLNLPQTQTKACVTGFERADRYHIQPQTVPEHGMLYLALKILPHPSRKQRLKFGQVVRKKIKGWKMFGLCHLSFFITGWCNFINSDVLFQGKLKTLPLSASYGLISDGLHMVCKVSLPWFRIILCIIYAMDKKNVSFVVLMLLKLRCYW